MRLHRFLAFSALIGLAVLLSSCGTIGYYSQAVGGHLKLMSAREPIDDLLKSESTDPELRNKLQTLVDARQFAVDKLNLPKNDSYNTYAATGRAYVTWNVVAAEEFSLKAKTWCFPVAGCVNYKGYFAEEDAHAYAKQLMEENLDVTVGGAIAYSTLGWFEDPVLDTMLRGSDTRFVGTLFHELAHQLLYIKDDSNFNEAFASFVEQEGVRIWLRDRNENERVERFNQALARSTDFSELLKAGRSKLAALYQEDLDDSVKRTRKQAVIDGMQTDYQTLKDSWGGYSGYDGWFSRDINNARLVSVATYRRLVPAFAAIYAEVDQSLPDFYAKAKEIAGLPAEKRTALMNDYLAREGDLSSP